MMKRMVEETIKKHELLEKNQHIVIGLSGGPDSVCLFYVLKELQEEYNIKLYAVHINHKLRPGAAEEDQVFVESLCKNENVPCYTFVEDCEKLAGERGITCEEAGRMVRYHSFAKVCQNLVDQGVKRENIRIAVAHNKEDQAETVMFRILRGTGTDGLAGIAFKRKDEFGNMIIRPLLDVSRTEIEDFCAKNHLSPRIDKTNAEPLYTRNKIRLNLLPYLKENFNENVVDALTRISKIAAEDKNTLWNIATREYEKSLVAKQTFSIKHLRTLDRAILHRIYPLALEKLGLTEDVTMSHYEAIDSLIKEDNMNPSAMTMLPQGVIVSKLYDKLTFVKKQGNMAQPSCRIGVISMDEFQSMDNKNVYAAFDMDKIQCEYSLEKSAEEMAEDSKGLEKIRLRTRLDGDWMGLSTGGRKKLQDFFVDEKVPKMFRDQLYVIGIGSEILWILPSTAFSKDSLKGKGRFSGNYLVNSQTKWVLFVEKTV